MVTLYIVKVWQPNALGGHVHLKEPILQGRLLKLETMSQLMPIQNLCAPLVLRLSTSVSLEPNEIEIETSGGQW